MKNYTTVKQSKKLLKLGLNLKTADMTFCGDNVIVTPYLEARKSLLATFAKEDSLLPCWSVGALQELILKQIEKVTNHKIDLILDKSEYEWCFSYFDLTNLLPGYSTTGKTQIEAVYSMVVRLLENGLF